MIEARRVSVWRRSYDLADGGRPLASFDARTWRTGGSFTLGGTPYEVRANAWGSRYELTGPGGAVLAVADRVNRREWTVEAQGRSYAFRRASWWRTEERLLDGGRDVGYVRRTSAWRGDAEADLPGLPEPVRAFVFLVVLLKWDAAAAAAASA